MVCLIFLRSSIFDNLITLLKRYRRKRKSKKRNNAHYVCVNYVCQKLVLLLLLIIIVICKPKPAAHFSGFFKYFYIDIFCLLRKYPSAFCHFYSLGREDDTIAWLRDWYMLLVKLIYVIQFLPRRQCWYWFLVIIE